MRVVLFIVYLYSFLLGGTQHGLQEQHQNHVAFSVPQQIITAQDTESIHKIHNGTAIDDADDLEEENYASDEARGNGTGKILFAKYFLPVHFSRPIRYTGTDYRLKTCKAIPPISGTSSPIYIKQRVLRI